MKPRHLVTVCERRRLAQAIVLAESYLRHHAGADALVVIADEPGEPPATEGKVRFATGADVAGDEHGRLAGALSTADLVDALVPFTLAAVGEPAVYLAADAWVSGPLDLPDEDALVVARGADGAPVFDPGFTAVRRGEALLAWWRERVTDYKQQPVAWVDAAVGVVVGLATLADDALAVAPWNAARRGVRRDDGRLSTGSGEAVRFVRFAGFRPDAPDALPGADLAALPALREELEAYAERVVARDRRLGPERRSGYMTAPDGTRLDARLRRLYARGVRDGDLETGPFSPAGWSAFLQWLGDPDPDPRAGGVSRYLVDLHDESEELQAAYPDLRNPDARRGFHGWVRAYGEAQHGLLASLLPEPPEDELRLEPPPWGVNVAGYFQSELGVGEAARRVVDALDAAQIPALPVQGSILPPTRRGESYGSTSSAVAPFPVNLLCVNADGLPAFAADVGEEFFAHRYTIGFWWWELAEFPAEYHRAFEYIDEVWVGSRHALEAIGSSAPVPVVHMPLPVRTPVPAPFTRAALGLPEGFVFLVTFDFNSVMARKNPLGAIEAFERAFTPGSGPSLVVKSINGHRDPESQRRLLAVAARHPDVRVLDHFVSAEEMDAMLAACDAYVSLHRAEGFGLGLAEAMALGKPVIATGYSGNVDYMDERTAWLVPFQIVPVGSGAEPYPAEAEWAEPDLDAAAAAMREVAGRPDEAAARGGLAAERIRTQHSAQAAGAAISRRLELIRARAEDRARGRGVGAQAAVAALLAPSRERAGAGAETYDDTAGARALGRRALLRAARPVTANQRAVDDAIFDGIERVAAHDERRHLDQLALYAGVLQRLRRQDERVAELERTIEAQRRRLAEDVDPLVAAARAVPYAAGDPFELFRHPVAGEVLGFRTPPAQSGPGERYRLFEDVFRGSRDRVAALVEPYVELLAGRGPVLDVGCGRGELLEALRAEGIDGSGVDTDAAMAEIARQAGLDVTVADAVEHLRGLPEGSLGAVTAIHVIEHLDPAHLQDLMTVAGSRLRPGGLFVAETINPHAGAALKTFWVDLTHRHPIFPEVALILAAATGYRLAFVMYPRGERVAARDRFVQDAYALVAEA
jgi:glycosyltransferase involved in cell wall biosynthesis/SAM-dependent methyltransferase